MNSITRLIGIAVLLVFVFLAAALGAQAWLRQQSQRLHAEALEAKRTQFAALAPLLTALDHPWTDDDQARFGKMIGGRVALFREAPPSPSDPALLYFDQTVPTATGRTVTARVSFVASPMTRLLSAYQRVTVGLLFFGFALLAVGAAFAALTWRSGRPALDPAAPAGLVRAEIGSLTHLAETSVAQSAALTRERDVRRLAEEDAILKQRLLNQSLEGKVRLGHDLHDGIIQSLYASGLTIESARTLIQTNPGEADRRLAQCIKNLNATIRDVRAYITGLAPENLRQASFAQAVESLIHEFRGGRDVVFELKVDDDATETLTPEQSTEALQIIREAVSNSLRHGHASAITVRLHQADREFCLLIQDNGAGFDAARHDRRGHGLGNMRARAQRIGGAVRVESQPAAGTRVVVTLPLLQPA